MTAKLWRESATHLMPILSSSSHRPLIAPHSLIHSQHSHQTDSNESLLSACSRDDQYGPADWSLRKWRSVSARRGCVWLYRWRCVRVCVCVCEPAVCGDKMMGKLREMRWVCGEEDTWGRGTLPHPHPCTPPPTPRCHAAPCRDAMRQHGRVKATGGMETCSLAVE